jgi:5-methylcytosine-specific restriction endonuclease McrA
MEEHILKLRAEGKTYNQIQSILGCSKSTISYYLSVNGKARRVEKNKNYRKNNPLLKKTEIFRRQTFIKNKTYDFQQDENNFSWREIIEKYGGWETECYLTGRKVKLDEPNTYSFDHIIPRSKGGKNTLDNLGITIKEANQAKSDMFLNDFFDLCKIILEKNGYKVEKNVVL